MIKESELDRLMLKLIKKQDNFNIDAMTLICLFIGGCEGSIDSQLHSLSQHTKNEKLIQKLKDLQFKLEEEMLLYIEEYFDDLARMEYASLVYENRKLEKFDKNKDVKFYTKITIDDFKKSYKSLLENTNVVIRDLANPRQLKSYTYTPLINSLFQECVQANQQQVQPYQDYMRRTVNQLCENGIRTKVIKDNTTYPKLENQFKTELNNKSIDFIQQLELMVGRQLGHEEVEISVVPNPAPDHAPIQGHRFTLDEYERMQNQQEFLDVEYNKYDLILRPIGMWNCRHIAMTKSSAKPRKYSDKELKRIITNSRYSYKMNDGGRFTRREAYERQVTLLARIKKYKEAYVLAKASNNEYLMQEYKKRIIRDSNEYRTLSINCKLPNEIHKAGVKGYK